eukprot:5629296-Pyramimonas_sp.AAC.1
MPRHSKTGFQSHVLNVPAHWRDASRQTAILARRSVCKPSACRAIPARPLDRAINDAVVRFHGRRAGADN